MQGASFVSRPGLGLTGHARPAARLLPLRWCLASAECAEAAAALRTRSAPTCPPSHLPTPSPHPLYPAMPVSLLRRHVCASDTPTQANPSHPPAAGVQVFEPG